MNWLFGSTTSVTLVIKPTGNGTKMAGFQNGPLALTCTQGETVQIVMDRFNTYRGPDNQILELWKTNNEKLPFSHVLNENITVFFRG